MPVPYPPYLIGNTEQNVELIHKYLIELVDYLNTAVDTGWVVSGVVSDKTFDAGSTTLAETAQVLGTLITSLMSQRLPSV